MTEVQNKTTGDSPEDVDTVERRDVVLKVENLSVELSTDAGWLRIVDDVNLTLEHGRTFGLVGESGSGKTVTSLAVLGMIRPPRGRVPSGSVRLLNRELQTLSSRELRRVRGRDIGMIFQEPRRSLDPAFTVGDQIAETVRAHLGLSRRAAWKRAVDMLDMVGIASASQRAHEYPHQFSGGMAQRVMLAIALSCSPKVLIADEPTTALDVTVQAQVLDLIRKLQAELGLAVLFISHDLGMIAEMCDRVAVMYAGQIVEEAAVEELFLKPGHPYTAALLSSIPNPQAPGAGLRAIPGVVPPAHAWPTGCRYHPRCAHAASRCSEEPPTPITLGPERSARCLLAGSLALTGVE